VLSHPAEVVEAPELVINDDQFNQSIHRRPLISASSGDLFHPILLHSHHFSTLARPDTAVLIPDASSIIGAAGFRLHLLSITIVPRIPSPFRHSALTLHRSRFTLPAVTFRVAGSTVTIWCVSSHLDQPNADLDQ